MYCICVAVGVDTPSTNRPVPVGEHYEPPENTVEGARAARKGMEQTVPWFMSVDRRNAAETYSVGKCDRGSPVSRVQELIGFGLCSFMSFLSVFFFWFSGALAGGLAFGSFIL